MPDLIVIRLHPVEPTTAEEFTNYLTDLKITAIEFSFDNLAGDEIGSAAFFPDPDTRIVQHVVQEPNEFGFLELELKAVATAVIKVESQDSNEEYGTFDIKLNIERAGGTIFHQQVYYNIPVVSGDLPGPEDFPTLNASLYLALPPPAQQLDTDQAFVNLPENGSPSNFTQLFDAILNVLDAEPEEAPEIDDFTLDQCRHVAREIIWNRELFPLPVPDNFEAMYTGPHEDEDAIEQERLRFEAALTSDSALHNAQALRLEQFVCALSAALFAEDASKNATRIRLEVPTLLGDNGTRSKIKKVDIVLTASGATMDPSFMVPAEVPYVLGAEMSSHVPHEQRYQMAILQEEPQVLEALQRAIETGVVIATQASDDEPPRINGLTLPQIARRLHALGVVDSSGFSYELRPATAEHGLVQAWLDFEGKDISDFWSGALADHAVGHLNLVLCAVTQNHQPLIDAIKKPPDDNIDDDGDPIKPFDPVINVSGFAKISNQEWRDLFLPGEIEPRTELLPAFTRSGSPEERVEVFIRHLEKFFQVSFSTESPGVPEIEVPPLLRVSPEDPIRRFIDATSFIFGSDFDSADFNNEIEEIFPEDVSAQAWLAQTLQTINDLWILVDIAGISDQLRISLAEALFSRGLIGPGPVRELSFADFKEALTGTVAFEHAEAIYSRSGPLTLPDPPDDIGFQPVNMDCCLVNCIPPPHLSPLGPVAYLHEMLQISEGSTCDELFPPLDTSIVDGNVISGGTISNHVNNRCGSPAGLLVTRANLETPLLLIDLVNECLEAVTASLPALPVGHIHNTASDELGGHALCPLGPQPEQEDNSDEFCHDPAALFEALPEHSTPATPVATLFSVGLEFQADLEQGILSVEFRQAFEIHGISLSGNATITTEVEDSRWRINDPDAHQTFIVIRDNETLYIYRSGAYEILASDFSHCLLPYSQPLDINRTYLKQLGTNRFETMRTFREETSEFVLDPENPPAEFESYRLREPVSKVIAAEYLGISPEVLELLFEQDIATSLPADEDQPILWQMYGFPTEEIDGESWLDIVVQLQEFLKRTCLTYCQFLELWRAEFVIFHRAPPNGSPDNDSFPNCEPCDLSEYSIAFDDPADAEDALRQLIVFIRLWRLLKLVAGAQYSFQELRDICEVLQLFHGDGTINADFIRQLSAFQRVRDLLVLPLVDEDDPPFPTFTGMNRTHLLSLTDTSATKFAWTLDQVLDALQPYAQEIYHCPLNPPHFLRLLAENMDAISRLIGFNPDVVGDEWNQQWTRIARMVEVLGKIYASHFSVGQILALFTVDPHLHGDDPFSQQPDNEALCRPFDLPDDTPEFSLWTLRDKLLAVEVSDEEVNDLSWTRMNDILREEFGYVVPPTETDHMLSVGQHFFPSVLEDTGVVVSSTERQYRTPLAATSAPMWNTPPPPDAPIRFDATTAELFTELPLTNKAFIVKLARVRTLDFSERGAVLAIYFAPRIDLCALSFLFPDMADAEDHLIQEPDERKRWQYFQKAFALFYARCHVIATHFAEHVTQVTGHPNTEGLNLAWQVLRHLRADENFATSPWEVDLGVVPEFTWGPQPHGGAFAALLGLVGTGLRGTFRRDVGAPIAWQEMRGPLEAFGEAKNAKNAPMLPIIPSMSLNLTPEQEQFFGGRNGFGINPKTGEVIGGVEGYVYVLEGLLLVEREGDYKFSFELTYPESDKFFHWFVKLSQGQKVWSALVKNWKGEEGPRDFSAPLPLRRGVYEIEVHIHRLPLVPDGPEDVCLQQTGFQIKYLGADTNDEWMVPPHHRLFLGFKEGPLVQEEESAPAPSVQDALDTCYIPTVRDMRGTAYRGFMALLCAHNHRLSAKIVTDAGLSEFDFFRKHPTNFQGVSYFEEAGVFEKHHVHYNFNFLPVLDNYHLPDPPSDQRTQPSTRRMQALFDVFFESLFDYTRVREEAAPAREAPAVNALHEWAEGHTDRIAHGLRHLGIHLFHKDLILRYFDGLELLSADLVSFHWLYRVWQAEKWIRNLKVHFLPKDIRTLRPDLVAATDPTAVGNANLTAFYRDGSIENNEPHRYPEIEGLNNKLRIRGQQALQAYLISLNRVALPWGGFAETLKDLSELLLIDVEAGVCQKASRIEEAISSIHLFIQRARLGLEPNFEIANEFILLWDRRFATYEVWLACKRRELYPENWIDWNELKEARRTEGFRFLESELRRATLTIPVPGGLEHWPNQRPPAHPGLTTLQTREPAGIVRLEPPIPPTPEGFDLLGTPERHARPSWLAALRREVQIPSALPLQPLDDSKTLPFWIQAAIRLGVRFIRVAAASEPPASVPFEARHPGRETGCCVECGKPHPTMVDEYYFWLLDSKYFEEEIEQNADWGVTDDNPVSDWHRSEKLPGLLHLQSEPMVHLFWCRVHNGEFKQTRRSFEGVRIDGGVNLPQLEFLGRSGDSLNFRVIGGQKPDGFPSSPTPGFRYDLATDSAVVLPEFPLFGDEEDELLEPPVSPVFPGGLPAYPYFAYYAPGAPLVPTLFSPALTVAGHLRSHCHYEAALKWYECFFNPLQEDLSGMWCMLEAPIVSDELARQRSIILHYVETLLAWGDALIRRHSPESFQQARLIFDTAARILGGHPHIVQMVDTLDEPLTVATFVPNDAPLNPNILALYDLVDDRLAMIHACLNASRLRNGRANKHMGYWGNTLVRNDWDSVKLKCHDPNYMADPCLDEADWCCPQSPYRFTFLVQKAQELANEVRGLGAALLAAYEKGDAEFLASLRATHERQLLNLTREIRKNQYRAADWDVQALGKSKEIVQTRKRYFETLLQNGLNAGEMAYQIQIGASLGFHTASRILEGIAEGLALTRDRWVGRVGRRRIKFRQLPVGNKLASSFSTAARITNSLADTAGESASLSLTQAGWARREDEWRHQVEIFGIEIEQIERQILAAERRQDIAKRELNNHQRQIEQAGEVHDFLRDKFTSHELYLWLQQETAALHYRMYELALYCARQAERAYNFERGHTSKVFINADIWDNLHEGLLAGERLQLALRQMEKSYLDCNVREYELTKHFSLRRDFPEAFLLLRTTGYCEIEIPEWMFDLDYPGHYLRRIKNVTLTLPAVVGPYTGVHCRLTLLSSVTRVTPVLIEPPFGCCNDSRLNNAYEALPDDPRIVKQYAATEAIATTSSGQNDAGMFEVRFGDERYLPFEYQGAASCYRIELPPENNQFDLDTLSDLILHLNYTAREGGDVLRQAANEVAQRNLPGGGLQFLDVKREHPNAWHRFKTALADSGSPTELNLQIDRKIFPYLFGNKKIYIEGVSIFFEAPDADPSAHRIVELWVDEEGKPVRDESRKCEVHTIHCIATESLPGLFHGVLEIELGPISEDSELDFGALRFASEITEVSEIFLIISYKAE